MNDRDFALLMLLGNSAASVFLFFVVMTLVLIVLSISSRISKLESVDDVLDAPDEKLVVKNRTMWGDD